MNHHIQLAQDQKSCDENQERRKRSSSSQRSQVRMCNLSLFKLEKALRYIKTRSCSSKRRNQDHVIIVIVFESGDFRKFIEWNILQFGGKLWDDH